MYDDDERLLRLLEIHHASTPEGSASVELWRAEQHLLDGLPLEDAPALFLLQAIPLRSELIDLRTLSAELASGFLEAEVDGTPASAPAPQRTPRGLTIQRGNRSTIEVRPNGYVALIVHSLRHRGQGSRRFSLGDQIAPQLAPFHQLCLMIDRHLKPESQVLWRLRCGVVSGPATLLVTQASGVRRSGDLPDDLIDLPTLGTESLSETLEKLTHLLEDIATVEDLH
jgi:hypothetical protein